MDSHPIMLMGVYDETLGMLIETRNYMAYANPRRARHHSWQRDCFFVRESLRVTTRLTQVMAWLLLQRAIACGEIPAQDACLDRNRLSGHTVCLDSGAMREKRLPAGLCNLLDRSLHLYLRVLRLEEMVVARSAMRSRGPAGNG